MHVIVDLEPSPSLQLPSLPCLNGDLSSLIYHLVNTSEGRVFSFQEGRKKWNNLRFNFIMYQYGLYWEVIDQNANKPRITFPVHIKQLVMFLFKHEREQRKKFWLEQNSNQWPEDYNPRGQ